MEQKCLPNIGDAPEQFKKLRLIHDVIAPKKKPSKQTGESGVAAEREGDPDAIDLAPPDDVIIAGSSIISSPKSDGGRRSTTPMELEDGHALRTLSSQQSSQVSKPVSNHLVFILLKSNN